MKKIALLLLVLLGLTGCGDAAGTTAPRAVDGVLDMSGWSLTADGPLRLKGEWEFYWQQLLTPEDFAQQRGRRSGFLDVPRQWNGAEMAGEKLGGPGYATYRLVLRHDPPEGELALQVLDALSSSRIYVNGRLVREVGRPADNRGDLVPDNRPVLAEVALQGTETEIVWQIANFNDARGGAWKPMILGLENDLRTDSRREVIVEMLMVGCILFMAIYHLILYAFRRRETALLWFAVACLLVMLRVFAMGERLGYQMLFDNFTFIHKMDFFSMYMLPPVFALLYHLLYPEEFSRRCRNGFAAVLFPLSALVLLTPPQIYSCSLPLGHLTIFAFLLYMFAVMVRACRRRRAGAVALTVAYALMFAAAVADLLKYSVGTDLPDMLTYGFMAMLLAQAYVLAGNFSNTFNAIQDQAEMIKGMGQAVKEGCGDLTVRLEQSAGETAELAFWFNEFLQKLDDVVAFVKTDSQQVDSISSEVAAGAQNLSSSTQLQAESVQRVASTIEEMSSMIRESAVTVANGREKTGALVNKANDTSELTRDLIRRMDEMSATSRKIEEIIATVNDVAFQTNLLALNAAVEAARAGEHGKGFAVVADEVRSLAQRSSEAARQIKTLIEETVQRINAGDQTAHKSVGALNGIIADIAELAEVMEHFAVSMEEQTSGIEEINGAMARIDDMTQNNAGTVEQLSASAENLRAESHSLAETVVTFRVSG